MNSYLLVNGKKQTPLRVKWNKCFNLQNPADAATSQAVRLPTPSFCLCRISGIDASKTLPAIRDYRIFSMLHARDGLQAQCFFRHSSIR